jgi:hypothetical protein
MNKIHPVYYKRQIYFSKILLEDEFIKSKEQYI